MPQRQPRRQGQGSGFVISKDGYAVTNNHVIDGAEEVRVKFSDGTSYKARVIGTDRKTDLALLKIKSDKNFVQAYEPLGNLFLKQGKNEDALTIFKSLLIIDPQYSERDKIEKLIQQLET